MAMQSILHGQNLFFCLLEAVEQGGFGGFLHGLALHAGIELGAGHALMLQQVIHQLVQLATVVGQDLTAVVVGSVDECLDLVIDGGCGFLRVALGGLVITADEDFAAVQIRYGAQVFAHTVTADHIPGKLGCTVDIIGRTGGNIIQEQSVDYAITMEMENKDDVLLEIDSDCICHTVSGKPIKPKTLGQKQYVDAIRNHMIVFGMGPAGTGKTIGCVIPTILECDNVSMIVNDPKPELDFKTSDLITYYRMI